MLLTQTHRWWQTLQCCKYVQHLILTTIICWPKLTYIKYWQWHFVWCPLSENVFQTKIHRNNVISKLFIDIYVNSNWKFKKKTWNNIFLFRTYPCVKHRSPNSIPSNSTNSVLRCEIQNYEFQNEIQIVDFGNDEKNIFLITNSTTFCFLRCVIITLCGWFIIIKFIHPNLLLVRKIN